MATSIGGTPIVFGDKRQPKALPLSHPKARYSGFKPGKTVLKKGSRKRWGSLALPCDILFERDVAVTLRDGTTVYVDVYRPTDSDEENIPAIIAWSPYGKEGGAGNQVLDDFPFRMGVPRSEVSDWQKWEGPDPAFWVNQGYAIVNPDARGVGKSEGNIYQFGTQEGRDGADVVDWVGQQPWCSGKVSLSGNSYLSISQWFIAAERPKHLACIAPWEGFTDLYGEAMWAGGVASKGSLDFGLKLLSVNAGENSWENTIQMGLDHEVQGAYHRDKAAKIENIEVPAYVVGSWSNPIHTPGTFCGYRRLKTEKWLRVHDSWEWPDYYQHENRDDLLRFFDHYLKGVDNGWEETPRVRLKIMDTANTLPLTGMKYISSDFPPPEAQPLPLALEASGKLSAGEIFAPGNVSYENKDGYVDFFYTFDRDCTLCGQIDMQLAVSLQGTKDADIFIYLAKELVSGQVGYQLKVPFKKSWQSWLLRFAHFVGITSDTDVLFYSGPEGRIRVSRRAQREDMAAIGLPIQRLDIMTPVNEDETVILKPAFTPIGMKFSKGEKLRVRIAAKDTHVFPPVDQATLEVDLPPYNTQGRVTIHCGAKDGPESFIVLPLIP